MYPDNKLKTAATELHESIVADLKAGKSWMETAVKHGVCVSTIYNHAKKAGLVKPRTVTPGVPGLNIA
jgi:hypothetical protein